MRGVIVIIVIAAAGVIAYAILPLVRNDHTKVSAAIIPDGALAAVSLPENLSQNAQIGKLAFDVKCASCHGTNAAGQDGVAPLWSTSFMNLVIMEMQRSSARLKWAFEHITGRLVICLLSKELHVVI